MWSTVTAAADLVAYGRWLTASSIAGFFATIGAQHWLRHSCDSIAVNTLAAVICGGLMLALAGWLKHEDRATRVFAVAGAASLAAAVLLLIEPACAHGPFGMVDPAIWPIWLGEVREMQPLLRGVPEESADRGRHRGVSGARRGRDLGDAAATAPMRRDIGFLAAAAVFLIAVVVTLGAIRGYLLCDLVRHADGRGDGAAAVRGAAAQDIGGAAWPRPWR